MALNFPNSPTNGQVFVDPNGQKWTYETATNSWTAEGAPAAGMVYKGSLNVTTAPPAGARAGWMYTVTTGGTVDSGFTGLTGNIPAGTTIIYDGANWQQAGAGVLWVRTGTTLAPSSTGDVVSFSAGTAALPGHTPVGDPDTGAWSPAPNVYAISTGGVERVRWDANGATMTGNLTVPSLNGGPLAGFRNLLINGQMFVNQRGAGPFAAGRQYTSDRWKASAGERVTVASNGPLNSNRLVVTGASVSITQGVELDPMAGRPGPFIQGSVWTVSVWATAPVSLSVAFLDTVLDTTNAVVVKADVLMTATSETNNGFTRYTATFAVGVAPKPTNRALQIGFNGVTGSIAMAQLEPGPVATPFERRSYGQELALCQRYYYWNGGTNDAGLFNVNRDNVAGSYRYPVTMRATPTVVLYNGTTANQVLRIDSTALNISAPYVVSSSAHGFSGVNFTNIGTGVGGALFNVQAAAEL